LLGLTSLPLLAWLSVAPRLPAQSSPPAPSPATGALTIQVIDPAAAPVAAAEVLLRGEGGRTLATRTDSAGFATFGEVAEGLWLLTVRRLGVRPVTASLRVAAGSNSYTVRTDPQVLTLLGVRVVGGRSYSARLGDFEQRRLSGVPSATVTRDRIERDRPLTLSRLLRGMSGLRIGDSLGSVVAISTRGDKPTRMTNGRPGFATVHCVMRVSVDGVILPALTSLDDIVPSDVHGIEVYFGPARMPPELAGLRTDNWCGLIAVWTRDR
jgi:hypothetical protein